MSVRCITQVLDRSAHSGTELLALVVLADYSDDDGNSYPAVASIARKCRMTPRNANYVLNALQASGELRVLKNEGPKGTNRYRIMLANLGAEPLKPASPLKGASPLKPASSTPEAGFLKPLKPASDEPSLNRQEPSSKARRVRSAPATVAEFMLPDWVPADTWSDFVAMRKSIRKPMTAAAMKLQIKTLDKLRADGHDPRAVLEQSIAASWQGLFPVKPDFDSSAGSTRSAGDVRPAWATAAGFANRFEAESAGCYEHNAAQFRDGRKGGGR